METLNTKEELIERVKDVLAVETNARDDYFRDYNSIKDEKIKSALLKIKNDEDKHVAILNSIIKILEKK